MKYLCLAYYDVKKMGALGKAELDAIVSQCPAYDKMLKDSGHLVLHGSLADLEAATVVKPRGGKAAITDGPFAETKEQVGGFFLIEAADLDEAIKAAMKHPAAHLGEAAGWGIEIRPIDFFESFKL
jgi:hypothetical protein